MGLLEQEIKELRIMNQQIQEDKISPKMALLRLAVYAQTEKRAKMILQSFAIAAKHGKTALHRISNSNLIGDGSYIDLEVDLETDKIMCPDLNKVITRDECLGYSGESEHVAACQSCKHFSVTRKLLMGENG